MIDLNSVRKLRKITDAPIGLCKKALTESKGDMVKAQELLKAYLTEIQLKGDSEKQQEEQILATLDSYLKGLNDQEEKQIRDYLNSVNSSNCRLKKVGEEVELILNRKYLTLTTIEREGERLFELPKENWSYDSDAAARLAFVKKIHELHQAGFMDWKKFLDRKGVNEREQLDKVYASLGLNASVLDIDSVLVTETEGGLRLSVMELMDGKVMKQVLSRLDGSKVKHLEFGAGWLSNNKEDEISILGNWFKQFGLPDGLTSLEVCSFHSVEDFINFRSPLNMQDFGESLKGVKHLQLRAHRVCLDFSFCQEFESFALASANFSEKNLQKMLGFEWVKLKELDLFLADSDEAQTVCSPVALAEIIIQFKMPQLTILRLRNLRIEMGEVLSGLLQWEQISHLEELDLSYCAISEEHEKLITQLGRKVDHIRFEYGSDHNTGRLIPVGGDGRGFIELG